MAHAADACGTAAWSAGDTVVVVMNRSDEPVAFKLVDGDMAAKASIPAHAIQTYSYTAASLVAE